VLIDNDALSASGTKEDLVLLPSGKHLHMFPCKKKKLPMFGAHFSADGH
jgi:hypothetical protein